MKVSVIHCSMPSTSTEWCLIMVVELVSIRPERLEWKSRQHSYRWTWEELHGMTQETPNFPQTIEPKLLLLIEKLSKRIICTGRGEEMKPERQLSTLNLYNDSNRVTTLSFCVCVCMIRLLHVSVYIWVLMEARKGCWILILWNWNYKQVVVSCHMNAGNQTWVLSKTVDDIKKNSQAWGVAQ